MAKQKIVVDEWLWADLGGENGPSAEQEAQRFLLAARDKCDQLVTVEGSPFLKKFYNFSAAAVQPQARNTVRIFKYGFLISPAKLWRLQEPELPHLPDDMARSVKEDDQYLVRAYLASKADVLMTTDSDLMRVLLGCGVTCKHREEFLAGYLA